MSNTQVSNKLSKHFYFVYLF